MLMKPGAAPVRVRSPGNPWEEKTMPIVTVAIPEGVYTREQKDTLIGELTDAIVRVGGEKQRAITRVMIQDYPEGNWGSGGKTFVRTPPTGGD
eukprot:jgi/Tetstr1/425424/TSEL_015871.t1